MGKTQITINPSFYKKMDEIENRVKHELYSKGEEIVSYAATISPVYSGAYVKSFSVVARGGGGGRSRTSGYQPDVEAGTRDNEYKGDKNALKQNEAERLRADIRSIDPLESEGFTLRNRSPHNKTVENKHNVFLRTKDRFR